MDSWYKSSCSKADFSGRSYSWSYFIIINSFRHFFQNLQLSPYLFPTIQKLHFIFSWYRTNEQTFSGIEFEKILLLFFSNTNCEFVLDMIRNANEKCFLPLSSLFLDRHKFYFTYEKYISIIASFVSFASCSSFACFPLRW